MLSTVAIISIFTEIFAAGIVVSGGFTFIKIFFSTRKSKDLFFGLFLLSFFAYVAAVIFSQLMYNLGRPLVELILVQRLVFTSLAISSFFLFGFVLEKFELKAWRFLLLILLFLVAYFIYLIFSATISLVYREEIIEPIVLFSSWIPVKPLFILAWIGLSIFSFGSALTKEGGRRTLALYRGFASLMMLASFLATLFYVRFGEANYLLISWGLALLSVLGLLLTEIIPPEAPEALAPLRFLRTRLLFKLLLVFILLIIIVFQVTTLVTISIGKGALSRSIQNSYLQAAENLVDKIQSFPTVPSFEQLQNLLLQTRVNEQGVAFIVDAQGRVIAHPDRKRALQRENMLANEAVRFLSSGKRGASEFRDELGNLMVGAYLPVKKFGWGVVIEEPLASAYFEMRRLETNSLIFVIVGIILTTLTGIFFAHSIEKPVKELILGTEAVARGELGYHISVTSADEMGKLAEAFNKMTRDLRESQERLILSEKLASLGTMAAGMAHEIKNPLVSLRTFTQLLQQKWEDKEFREKFSIIIPHEIERINRIAESLLKFGRPTKPELTKVDINSLLEEVLLLFESECKKYNVRVTKKLAELPEISGDAGQLSQAFVNLIKNAIEAMHEKGGELIVKTDVGEVVRLGKIRRREGIKKGEEMVWGEEEELGKPIPVVFVEITDTGEGISEENLKSLFDPFFTTKMTGTGMGLPITLRIIEEHRGSIKVRSRLGKGTTFIITLPQRL